MAASALACTDASTKSDDGQGTAHVSTSSLKLSVQEVGDVRRDPDGDGSACRHCSVFDLTPLLIPSIVFAQSPWERAASNLERTFTGPLARSLALVAIVIGGLMFMFGEGGAKRQISGIVFGGGLALFASQFLLWLF